MIKQIIETWHINNRVNLMLLDAISEEGIQCTLSKRGGGTPAKQFAHIHNVRLYRLENYAKEIYETQKKIELKSKITKELLNKRLTDSASAVERWIKEESDADGKIKGFKKGTVVFLGYIISHEAHHRGNILLTLKQCGYKLPAEITYGIWAWNQI